MAHHVRVAPWGRRVFCALGGTILALGLGACGSSSQRVAGGVSRAELARRVQGVCLRMRHDLAQVPTSAGASLAARGRYIMRLANISQRAFVELHALSPRAGPLTGWTGYVDGGQREGERLQRDVQRARLHIPGGTDDLRAIIASGPRILPRGEQASVPACPG